MIKKKLLYKMLALYLSIILVYTLFAGTLTLYKELEISSLKNNHSNILYMNQARDFIDYKLDIALKFTYKVSVLPSMSDYKYSEYFNYIYLTTLYNDLSEQLEGFTQLGFSLGILKSGTNMIISPEGTHKYDYYLKQLGIDPEKLGDLEELFSTLSGSNTFIVPLDLMKVPSNQIIMLHRIPNRIDDTIMYYFIVLDTNVFLPHQSRDSSTNAFSIYSDDLVYSFSNTNQVSQKEIFNYIDSKALTSDIIDLTLNSASNYIYKSKVINNLYYVYTVPNLSLFTLFFNILKTTFIPSLILFLFGLGIAYKATQTSYQPIYQLTKLVKPSETNALISQKNNEISELDYIKQGIESAYSANTRLQTIVDDSLSSLQEDFFRKILYAIKETDFIDAHIEKLGLEAFRHNLTLILLELEGFSSLNKIMPLDYISNLLHKLTTQFKSNTRNRSSNSDSDFFILPLDTKKYIIITHNLTAIELEAFSNQVINQINDDFSLDTVACVSSFYALEQLSSALQEILMLSKCKYSSLNPKIITKETLKESTDIAYYYPLQVETYLINYVTSNDFSKAKDLLVSTLQKNIVELNIEPETLKNLKYSLLTTFKRCLNIEDKTLSHFNKECGTLINNFIEASTTQVEEACLQLFEVIFNSCNKDKFSLDNSTASNIFMYIHENFDKDISLTDIANHFNLSESYVSKLFKSSLDINFKTYVNKLKVKKSKELLAQGSYKVSEVATIVGCNNANTFIRIFKQYEGISPGEYVKNTITMP